MAQKPPLYIYLDAELHKYIDDIIKQTDMKSKSEVIAYFLIYAKNNVPFDELNRRYKDLRLFGPVSSNNGDGIKIR